MLKKKIKLSRSILKLILPLFYRLLIFFKLNRRTINFLEEKSYFSNQSHEISFILKDLLQDKKLIALDVGAQGGFNSDGFFKKKYNSFFESILVEPIKSEAEKLMGVKNVINKGLWSKKEIKKLYILKDRPGSSSMYEPEEKNFDLHKIKKKDYDNFKVSNILEIECDTIENSLTRLDFKYLDYLKIDTQGAELEILKGLGNYRPLIIKVEAHVFSMYKNVPSWHQLLNFLYDINYILIDWKSIGGHVSRIPAEMDLIFIPNFKNQKGEDLIKKYKERFISLMLIFGQINLLKLIMKRLNIKNKDLDKFEDLYFN